MNGITLDIPKIEVITEPILQTKQPDGLAGRVAVIADLGIASTDIIVGSSYKEFADNLVAKGVQLSTVESKNDYKSIIKMYSQKDDSRGVTFLTVAPIGSTYNLTNFNACLDKLESEDFDILVIPKPIAYETTGEGASAVKDTYLKSIKKWLETRYSNKAGVGVIFSLPDTDETTSESAVNKRLQLFDGQRGVYSVIVQPINGYTMEETVGFMTATIAGRKLNKSLTHKIIKGIESITDVNGNNKELGLNVGDTPAESGIGITYMNAGVTVLRPFNRRTNEFGVLRSTCPSGFDLAIERSADYMTRQFQLVDYLGEESSIVTLDAIAGEINSKAYIFTEVLSLCNAIETNIRKIDYHTVEIEVKYLFDGIIDYIRLYIAVKELNE